MNQKNSATILFVKIKFIYDSIFGQAIVNPLFNKYFSLVRRFLPQPERPHAVGLDIGVSSCKLIELAKSADGYEIVNWGIEPIANGDSLAAIKKLFERLGIEPRFLATSVFGKGTLIRFIEIPRMAPEDLKKSFEIEIDKYLPFPKDQIFTDCYIIDPDSNEKQMTVLVGAAKKEMVNDRLNLLGKVDLPSDFLSINSIAMANVFNCLGPQLYSNNGKSAMAVIDIGETVSNLIIMGNHMPRFTRDIFIGAQELNKRISNVLGISLEEAKNLKIQPNDRGQDIINACESVLMNLISEIRLSFDYFTTEKNMTISKLHLTGGSSLLNGIVEFFSKNLDIAVERWNPIQPLKLAPTISSNEINQQASRLGVALGLALSYYD